MGLARVCHQLLPRLRSEQVFVTLALLGALLTTVLVVQLHSVWIQQRLPSSRNHIIYLPHSNNNEAGNSNRNMNSPNSNEGYYNPSNRGEGGNSGYKNGENQSNSMHGGGPHSNNNDLGGRPGASSTSYLDSDNNHNNMNSVTNNNNNKLKERQQQLNWKMQGGFEFDQRLHPATQFYGKMDKVRQCRKYFSKVSTASGERCFILCAPEEAFVGVPMQIWFHKRVPAGSYEEIETPEVRITAKSKTFYATVPNMPRANTNDGEAYLQSEYTAGRRNEFMLFSITPKEVGTFKIEAELMFIDSNGIESTDGRSSVNGSITENIHPMPVYSMYFPYIGIKLFDISLEVKEFDAIPQYMTQSKKPNHPASQSDNATNSDTQWAVLVQEPTMPPKRPSERTTCKTFERNTSGFWSLNAKDGSILTEADIADSNNFLEQRELSSVIKMDKSESYKYLKWNPDNCDIPKEGLGKCMVGKKVAFLGDFLLIQLYESFVQSLLPFVDFSAFFLENRDDLLEGNADATMTRTTMTAGTATPTSATIRKPLQSTPSDVVPNFCNGTLIRKLNSLIVSNNESKKLRDGTDGNDHPLIEPFGETCGKGGIRFKGKGFLYDYYMVPSAHLRDLHLLENFLGVQFTNETYDYIVLNYGHHDIYYSVTDFMELLKQPLDYLRKRYFGKLLFIMPWAQHPMYMPLGWEWSASYEKVKRMTKKLHQELKVKQIPWIDTFNMTLARDDISIRGRLYENPVLKPLTDLILHNLCNLPVITIEPTTPPPNIIKIFN